MTYIPDKRGGCWPTPTQELLLQAAILRGNDALDVWKEWISSVDIERLDLGSYRLLPLLYQNLKELGVEDPAMKKLKGVYRYTWCKNQVLFHNIASLLKKYQEAGIETMALKGAALVLLHYKDYGLRPMDDFDVLVPTQKAMQAVDILEKSGWVPVKEFSPHVMKKLPGAPFRHSDQLSLDLHWHVLDQGMTETADDDFWKDAITTRVNDISTCALNPTDQLLHAFVHGIRWNNVPPFRWVADACAILKTSESEIDWNRLMAKAREFRVILPVRDGLRYVQKTFDVSVPSNVVLALQDEKVPRQEKLAYDVHIRPYNKYGKKRLTFIWVRYQRYLNREVGTGFKDRLLSFPEFFKKGWRVEKYRDIPIYIIKSSIRSIFQMMYWHMPQKLKGKIDEKSRLSKIFRTDG
jgi:hypothetical protein